MAKIIADTLLRSSKFNKVYKKVYETFFIKVFSGKLRGVGTEKIGIGLV